MWLRTKPITISYSSEMGCKIGELISQDAYCQNGGMIKIIDIFSLEFMLLKHMLIIWLLSTVSCSISIARV